MVKNPPFNNAGDVGSIPGQGTDPHRPQLESPCATSTEPAHSGAHVLQLRPDIAKYETFAGHNKQNQGSRSGCNTEQLWWGWGWGQSSRKWGPEESTLQAERTACASLEGARKESEVFQRLERLAQVCGGLPGGGSARQGPGHAGFAGRGEPGHFIWCAKSREVLIRQATGSSIYALWRVTGRGLKGQEEALWAACGQEGGRRAWTKRGNRDVPLGGKF